MPATVEAVVVTMARSLRALGVAAPPDSTVAFATALAEVGLVHREHAYWAGRATLVRRPEDTPTYDRVFAAVFGAEPGDTGAPTAAVAEEVTLLVDTDDGDAAAAAAEPEPEPTAGASITLRWSGHEVLRDKDFAHCSSDELDEAHRLMADLRVVAGRRRSRRLRPSTRVRGPIDLRATARRSLRTAGEPLSTAHRERADRPRHLVLLCDVSGSMEPYARALVRFAHAAVAGRTPVEVFTLGTRCTRITRQLRTHDPDAALAAAAAEVHDWSGGTRLGEGLRTFNDVWGVRGMARGATVVVLSDGWDRGDASILGTEVARLHRVANRLIWVNPLKAAPGFAPLAAGMAAALPHVDLLVEGHSLASLESLAAVIAGGTA
jgi:uncharacterized protein with von Willebrand factor type A (vWA) domain